MNEQALQDAYELFTAEGYQGSLQDFVNLINSNPNALQDSYDLFKEEGYAKPIEDYQVLVGVKKKDGGASTSEVGLLEPPTVPQVSSTEQPESEQQFLKTDAEGEVDYFQGTFGDILRGLDSVAPVGIGDFVDDMARSIASGYRRGVSSENAADLLVRGNKATDEDIYSFIEANKNAQALPPSKEMENYMKTYEDSGKGIMGVVLGLVKNPTVIPEIIFSSFTSMATNTDSIIAGLSAIGTGAALGAPGGPVGIATGAGAAIPYAFAAAGSVLEMGATFAEVLEQEAEGEELTPDKVRELISKPEVYNRIRNKAVTRGLTIGAVDAFTARMGGRIAKEIIKSAKTKPFTKAAIAGTVTEGVGGSAGEAAAQLATGQELDISDIALEGIAELPMGVINLASQKKVKPAKYVVNDVESTKEEVDNMIETMTLEELTESQGKNIKIENDEQTQQKLQDKITFLSKKKSIKNTLPNLNEPTLDEITNKQIEIDNLENETTEVAKEEKSKLRQEIKELTENQLDPNEQVTTDQKTDEQVTTEQDIVEDTTNQEQVSENLFINRSPEEVQVIPERESTIKKVIDIAKVGAKSVRKILPNMRIVMHETQEQFKNATNKTGRAFFDAQDTIHINLSKATLSTAPHEIFHAVFLKNIKTNKQAAQQAENMMKSVRKVLPDNSPLAKRIDEFAESYTDVSELQNEERAAELFGIMATEEAYSALPTPTKNIIIKFLEDIAKTIGLDINLSEFTRTDEDVINLLNTLSERVRTGEEIQQSDIEILDIDSNKTQDAPLIREQRNIEDVTRLYNMNTDGFIPKTANLSQLRKAVEPFGFEAFRSREDQFGQGGGLFIKKPGQRRYKPPRLGGRQQVEQEPGASKERVLKEIEGIIEKSKKRGRQFKQIPKNVISYLEQTKLYEQSSDVQREALFRDVRKRLGIKEKSAPSVKRLFGTLKDVKKVTFTEKNLLYKRIKDIQEGAKTLKVALKKAEKVLGQELKELSVNGTITVNQMTSIMSRLRKTDLLNPVSRDNFIDYMTRVMADVDYTNKIRGANTKLKKARKAVETKIGIASGIKSQLQRVFSISPSRVPLQVLDNYLELINIFSQPKQILDLPTQNKIEELYEPVLKQLDEELSMSSDLSDRLAETDQKVFKDGKLDYRATIQKMLDTGQIDDREFEVMRKYKSQILPTLEPTQKSEAEIEAAKTLLKIEIATAGDPNPNNLPSRDERDVIREFAELIRTKALDSLTPQELTNVLRILDNIQNGYLPHAAKTMVNRLNAINSAAEVQASINKAKILPVSKIYSRIKGVLTRKNKLVELVRRSPFYYIDQLFGDFATKNIYEATLGRISRAYANYNKKRKELNIKLRQASEAVRKSLGDSQNRFVESTYKQMVYLIQKEYLSNPGSNQVNQAADFLRETIKQIKKGKTRFREQDAKILQDILDKYTNDQGQINNDKLFKSFNTAEKQSIQTIEDINAENTEKAVFTANIIRGESIKPLSNYVHLNVEQDVTNKDLIGDKSFFETFTKVLMPSTKAKSLIERTGAVSPLNFDVYASVQRGTKFLLMDYYLTDPIRTGRKTLNLTEKALDDNENTTAEQQEIFNAIRFAFNEYVNDLAYNSFGETSLADEITSFLSRTGYRTILAGAGRFIAEFTSNFGFAMITDPKAMIAGMKLSKLSGSEQGVEVLSNTGSSQTTRIYDSEGDISGKFLDPSVLQKKDTPRQQGAVSGIEDTILKYWNKTGKKWVNGVEFVADKLISTPDKLVMRPLWFGNFQLEFQKIAGKKPDFSKIAANDETYMNENSEAIKAARELADKKTVMAGATDNPFMGMLKGRAKPNQSVFIRGFNNFNNFMTRFLIFEYITARTGVANLLGKGELSPKQGGALIGGVMTRMVLYSMIGTVMAESLGSLFTEDDDDFDPTAPDKIKDFPKLFGQALLSAFTSLTLGRDFGNATKAIVNYGVEEFNESQLEFLRDGEYNEFRDALQYNIIPRNKGARGTDAGDFLKRVLAAYGPLVGTTDLLIKVLTEEPKKTLEARERQVEEQQIRLPLEIMGNLGLIPLYKDVRNIVLKNLYGDLAKAQRQLKNKKKQREEMLQGYESEADMKRYDFELWNQTFGPESEGYDEREAERQLKLEERRLKRQLKDELYNYQPRRKRTRKKKSRFTVRKKKSRF